MSSMLMSKHVSILLEMDFFWAFFFVNKVVFRASDIVIVQPSVL